jgi:hypothetical protein
MDHIAREPYEVAHSIAELSFEMRRRGQYDLGISIAKGLVMMFQGVASIIVFYAQSLARDGSQEFIPDALNEMIKIMEDHPEILDRPCENLQMLDIVSQFAYRCGSEYALFVLRKIAPISNNPIHYLRISEFLSDSGDIGLEYEAALKKAIELDPSCNTQTNIAAINALMKIEKRSIPTGNKINKYPSIEELNKSVDEVMKTHLLQGQDHHLLIDKTTRFFTMGSCFAANLSLALKNNGFHSTHLGLEEEANTTFANVALINAIQNSKSNLEFNDVMKGIIPTDFNLEAVLAEIKSADVFIFTLGVATAFFHKQTGETLMSSQIRKNWRALEIDYEYKMSTVEENVNNLIKVIEFIRNINSNIKIFISVSPVPIMASFSGNSAVQTDCISKSIMRITANEIVNHRNFSHIQY